MTDDHVPVEKMPLREEFVLQHQQLLQLEREAEMKETRILLENRSPRELQRQGVCLLQLRVGARRTGIYGRPVVMFEPFWGKDVLPAHVITTGDIVGVSHSSGGAGVLHMLASGVVTAVHQSSISMSFDASFEDLRLEDDIQYNVVKLANDVTYRRLKSSLQALGSNRECRAAHLAAALFGECGLHESAASLPPSLVDASGKLSFLNEQLDSSQRAAVEFALLQPQLAIIHGPPGTGKTTTVVEIIRQAVRSGNKVLACAPSNIAVDNLLERLASCGVSVVRLGHPARALQKLQQYSLDAILCRSEETKLVRDVRAELDKNFTSIRKARSKGERQRLRTEVRALKKELKDRESAAMKEVLHRADVVVGTLTSVTPTGPLHHVRPDYFSVTIIDECTQALEAACWIALPHAPKVVLAGDHHQLPPTILSPEAAAAGLADTLMERLITQFGTQAVQMLTTQYRMNSCIMEWPSVELYEGKLVAHGSVAHHLLKHLDGIEANEDTSIPLLLIDTAGCEMQEATDSEEISRGNKEEAELVALHIRRLVQSGLSPTSIAVITPYNLQVDILRMLLLPQYPLLEVKSVDGFQGREKEAVVLSLVRSNPEGQIGFLAEDRRLNVAVTRARRHLCVVCDSETVSHHSFLKKLIKYLESHGEVRSAQQYEQELQTFQAEQPECFHQKMTTLQQQPTGKGSRQCQERRQRGEKEKTRKATLVASQKNKTGFVLKEREKAVASCLSCVPGADRERGDNRQATLEEVVQRFVKSSSEKEYSFPASLNSFERRLVHEIAEKYNLIHESRNDGDQRHIVIKMKPKIEKSVTHLPESAISGEPYFSFLHLTQDTSDEDTQEKTDTDEEKTKENCEVQSEVFCNTCQKTVTAENYSLHQLRCARDMMQPANIHVSEKSRKEKKNKTGNNRSGGGAIKNEDFESLLESFRKLDNVCNFDKCKTHITDLGQKCPFCVQRFCISHHFPEVHGCGAEARVHARQVISRDGVVYRGSGVPSKKPDPAKRAHMQRKLDKKLTEITEKRKPKKPVK